MDAPFIALADLQKYRAEYFTDEGAYSAMC